MIEQLSRSYVGEVTETIPGERSVVARIGTGDLDRFQTVIDPAGMDLRAFRENPVVLWEHGKDPTRGRLPIGRNLWIKARKSGNGELLAKTVFAKDDYSQNLYEMYRDGMLRGWSIHALPDQERCSPPTREERKARPELARCQMMYRGTELTEYSGTAVPGNARTLTMLEERGIWVPDEARAVAKLPTPIGGLRADHDEPDADDTGGAPDGDADDRVRRDGDAWVATDDDGNETRHPSEAEARECLASKGKARSIVAVPIDFLAIQRRRIDLIERHFGAMRDELRAHLDLMRGKV